MTNHRKSSMAHLPHVAGRTFALFKDDSVQNSYEGTESSC